MDGNSAQTMVVLGRISGVFGVRGWVKVYSETDPRENILRYSPWYLGKDGAAHKLIEGRPQGKTVVAQLDGCEDRDRAAALVGQQIAVRRGQLPPPSPGEFYWIDLEGLRVETLDGVALGQVSHLLATGANDVLVVRGERERLLPFVWDDVIKLVDFDERLISVDWDPDF